jgi:hypothetical protein
VRTRGFHRDAGVHECIAVGAETQLTITGEGEKGPSTIVPVGKHHRPPAKP